MKSIVRKLVSTTLILTMVLICATAIFILADEESSEANASSTGIVFEESKTAQEIYASSNFIPSDELDADFEFSDGLTVIYGSNLSVKDIFIKKSYDEIVSEKDAAAESESSDQSSGEDELTNEEYQEIDNFYGYTASESTGSVDSEETDDNAEEIETNASSETNTFIIMCLQSGGKRDIEYVSVSYEDDVDIAVINGFVEGNLESEALSTCTKDFICEKLGSANSVYNSGSTELSATSTTSLVMTLKDTNYYIANYTPSSSSTSYPLMIYKKNIIYNANIIANKLTDANTYVLTSYVTVTPGNAISTSEANGYASRTDLKNSTYKNAIIVKGVKSYYENLFPNQDYYITMSPMENKTNVNGMTFTVSTGAPGISSASFVADFETGAKVNMDYSFDSTGTSYVKFEGYKNGIYSACLSTEQFSFITSVYLYSGYDILYTNVGTNILYYFQGTDPSAAKWAGTPREFYYET
ncbi:MAG: hypothetical protein LUI61_03000 [Firmicutes bacterium]|nr:hypothetical protein [Bacillota bacterium]